MAGALRIALRYANFFQFRSPPGLHQGLDIIAFTYPLGAMEHYDQFPDTDRQSSLWYPSSSSRRAREDQFPSTALCNAGQVSERGVFNARWCHLPHVWERLVDRSILV